MVSIETHGGTPRREQMTANSGRTAVELDWPEGSAYDNAGMKRFTASLSNVDMHYVIAGEGEPLVLLHGWPQTWFTWRHLMPLLADRYTLIAPDLRGLGDTSIPESGYDKLAVAGDVRELITDVLGCESVNLAGHDWGGVTAFMFTAAFPELVRRLAVVDVVVPGLGSQGIDQSGRRWHHGFHRTPGLPEALVAGREDVYLTWFFEHFGATETAISQEDSNEYLRSYSRPGRITAGFEYYRATPQDTEDIQRLIGDQKLAVPMLGIGGGNSWGRGAEVAEALAEVGVDVRAEVVRDAGHWVPEEQPQVVADHFRSFFL